MAEAERVTRAGYLGAQDDLRAPPAVADPLADDALGSSIRLRAGRHRVHLRRVDQIDAVIERVVDLRMPFCLGILLAEGHRAQPDEADAQAGPSKRAKFHQLSLSRRAAV